MDLNSTNAVIRPRQSWEAIDLGFLMTKRWFGPAIKAWVAVTLPLYVLLLVAFFPNPIVATLVLWWFKPLWERIPLYVYSRALFGSTPTLGETLRAFPKLALKQGIQAVTIRRLSPTRSFDQAVSQLEGLSGKDRQQRLRVLNHRDSGAAFWLLILLSHIELIFTSSLVALLILFIPQDIDINWVALLLGETQASTLSILEALFYYSVISIVGLFYVGGSFSLYLNRRTLLEGWDIELAFRRLNNRVIEGRSTRKKYSSKSKPAALSIILTLSCISQLTPSTAFADVAIEIIETLESSQTTESDIDYSHLNRDSSAELIITVLEGDRFHNRRTVDTWQLKDQKDKPEPEPWDLEAIKEFIKKLWAWYGELTSIAQGLKIVLWGLFITLVATVIYRYRYWLANINVNRRKIQINKISPETLFGLDITESSLPEQPANHALSLWEKEKHREALSLLYRATLARLVFSYGFYFDDSLTELECLSVINKKNHSSIHLYLKQLTSTWQQLAYGHQHPENHTMEDLCRRWNLLFDRPSPTGASTHE